MLYMYRRVVFGDLVKPALQAIKDVTLREAAILVPLAVVIILMGVYPKPVFQVTDASVSHLIARNQAVLALDKAPAGRENAR
jgi:NADH-quinone oxidoreductase subunit M